MLINYCVHCFAKIAPDIQQCPYCKVLIQEWACALDYEARLIHALNHPLAAVRMRAIIALGKRHDQQAAAPLVCCTFRHPIDVVEGLAVVASLRCLCSGRARSEALGRLVCDHPAHAVRAAAAEVLTAVRDVKLP